MRARVVAQLFCKKWYKAALNASHGAMRKDDDDIKWSRNLSINSNMGGGGG